MQCNGFVQLLADARDDATWCELAAGFLTVRSAHEIFDAGPGTEQMVGEARRVCSRVSRIPLRNRLFSIINHLESGTAEPRDKHRIDLAREILALGADLHALGHLEAANDVYAFVAVQYADDYDTRIEALRKQAYALRLMGRWVECALAYGMMSTLAGPRGDIKTELDAKLGEAFIEIEQGERLDAADAMLVSVLKLARAAKQPDVIGRALAARASVAGQLNNHVDAITLAIEALEYADRRVTREHTLHVMSVAFREVGHADSAIQIADHLLAHASESYVRTMAGLHRYQLAIDARDTETMARLEPDLASAPKPPRVAFSYHEALARGLAADGRFSAAEREAINAVLAAETAGLSELAARGEAALAEIRANMVPAVYQFRPAKTTTAAERKLAAVEKQIPKLCAA